MRGGRSGGIHEEQDLGVVYDGALIRRLLSYARPHARGLAGCVALLFALTGLHLLQPYLIKLAIDGVLQAPPASRGLDGLLPYVGAYFAVGLLAAGVEYAQGYWLRVTGQAIIARIRHDVFAHLQTLDLAYFDRNPVGRLVTRATNDVEALNEMYTSVLVNLFKDLFMILGAMAVMLAMDARLALVSFAALPAVALVAWLFQRLARKAWRDVRVKLARINATLAENFAGVRTIQVFAREARTAEEFRAINADHFAASMHQLHIYAVFRPLLELVSMASLAALLWWGGAAALAGGLTFGTLFAFTHYNRQLFEPVNAVAEKYNVLQSALASAERIFQLLATAPAITDPPATEGVGVTITAEPVPAVEFRDVWFAYEAPDAAEPRWVLAGVSFKVMPGETTAFVGHTGAGKSTIMALVARFYDVQRGSVLVDGVDVRAWSQAALRHRVGTVMQDVFLFAGDVAFNVALGDPAIDREAVEAAGRLVGADGFVAGLPGGWDAPVAERGATFSAGQRQLLAFARTLAHQPGILVLDEATASVDTETEQALQKAMGAARRARTTLVVAHRLSTIQDADRIHVMHRGRIVEAGAHGDLLAEGGLYARLWQLQAAGTGPLPPSVRPIG